MALPGWDGHSRLLGICDLEQHIATVFEAAPDVQLLSPALSPDGSKLIVGVGPIRSRLRGLLLVSVRGDKASRRVDNLVSTYSGASFSADGRRLLVFAGDRPYGPQRLVEIDLDNGAETPVTSVEFSHGLRTAYDPLSDDLLVAATGPSPRRDAPDAFGSADYDMKHGSPRNFRISREGGAQPLAPAEQVGAGAQFRGVTSKGEALLQSFGVEAGYRTFLVAPDGAVLQLAHISDPDNIPDGTNISSDGARLLQSRLALSDEGESSGRFDLRVGAPGSDRWTTLSTDDLKLETRPLRSP